MASTAKSSTLPRLRIRDATEADLPAITRIHFDAFNPGVMHRLIYPRAGEDASSWAAIQAKFAQSVLAPVEQPPRATRPLPVEKVVMVAELLVTTTPAEDGPGEGEEEWEVIAFAQWRIVKEALSEEEWDVEIKEKTAEELGEGTDVEVFNAFIIGLNRTMKEFQKGQPLIYLNILACQTARHRHGAGSALLGWGTDKADREGKPAYLEASPAGYPLYRRFGFADLGVQDLPVGPRWGAVQPAGEDWGGQSAVALAGPAPAGVFRTAFMRREPKAKGQS